MAQFDNFYANARRSENDGSYYQRLIKLIKQYENIGKTLEEVTDVYVKWDIAVTKETAHVYNQLMQMQNEINNFRDEWNGTADYKLDKLSEELSKMQSALCEMDNYDGEDEL